MRHFSFFLLIFVLLLVSLTLVQAEEKRVIQGVEYLAQSETKGSVHIKISDNDVTPLYSHLGGKFPRIVFDFKETVYETANKINVVQPALLSAIRFGLHKDPLKTRVVMDLSGICRLEKPTIGKNESGFEIFLNCQPDVDTATQTKEAVTGKLTAATGAGQGQNDVSASVPRDSSEKKKEEMVSVKEQIENQDITAEKGGSPSPVEKNSQDSDEIQSVTVSEKNVVDVAHASVDEKVVTSIVPADSKPAGEKARESQAAEAKGAESVISSSPVVEEKKFELTEIAFSRLEDKDEEIVLFYLDGFKPPVISALEEGRLLVVCDFKNTRLHQSVGPTIPTYGNYIEKITTVVSEKGDSLKVTLELAPENDYDLRQTFYKTDNVFSLVVTKADQLVKE